jgi:hypothetical protein
MMSPWILIHCSKFEFSWGTRVWLKAEEAKQASQSEQSAQTKEGIGNKFEKIAA